MTAVHSPVVTSAFTRVCLAEEAVVDLDLGALQQDLQRAGVSADVVRTVMETTRRHLETPQETIERLRAAGLLPPAAEPLTLAPERIAALEDRLPADLDDADRAEVLRIAATAQELR